MPRRARLACRFVYRKLAAAARASTKTICAASLMKRMSRQKGATRCLDAVAATLMRRTSSGVALPIGDRATCKFMPLADRRCVDQAALGPQCVLPARQAERAEVALEDLTVVAHVLDRTVDEVIRDAQLQAHVALHAEQAAGDGVFAGEEAVYVLRRDAQLFSLDHAKHHPVDNIAPGIVAVPNDRSQRLLGHDHVEDDVRR